MNDDRIIPTGSDLSVVSVTLLVDGSALPPQVEVLSILTEKEANRIPFAKLTLRDGDAAAEDFPLSNEATLIPGKTLEIKAGYTSGEETLFKGIIVKHGIKVRGRGSSALIVECRDAAVRMTVGRHSRQFIDQVDSAVIERLISGHDLTPTVTSTQLIQPQLIQLNATDWDFILSRAEANGLLVLVDDGEVSVAAPRFSGAADLSIRFGDSVYELDAEIDARHQFGETRAYAWDHSAQEVAEGAGSPPSPANTQGNLSEPDLAATIGLETLELRHGGRRASQELKAWADAALTRASLAKIVGRARIRGTAAVKPGQLLEINGVGERFSGTAFVAAVRHEIVSGAWYTEIQFGLPPHSQARHLDIMPAPAGGLLPAVHGLQIGVATALAGDPDGEDRILVRLPLVAPETDGIWARWVAPDAGENRGVFFRPEIGDELVVGFLADDPRDPVVLGMVHSSQHTAPIVLSDDNQEKGIVTREGLRLHFNDETKVITIETPGGNKAMLDDDAQGIRLEDQHGNSITLNADGITLDGSVITLTAQQGASIEAGTDLKASAGANAELTAGAQLKAEGSAGAELKSSAILTIQGSLVKIN